MAGHRGRPSDGVFELQVGGLQPSGKTPGPQRFWVSQPSQPTPTDTVVVYPPIQAGLSREKHVARLSLKSPFPQVRGCFLLVGDTGSEPVASSVSGIISVLKTLPLSTKSLRACPPMSTRIRGRYQAISQSANTRTSVDVHGHTRGRADCYLAGRCPPCGCGVPVAAYWSFQYGVQECAGQGDGLIEGWRRPRRIGRRPRVAAPPYILVGDRERIWEGQVPVRSAGPGSRP